MISALLSTSLFLAAEAKSHNNKAQITAAPQNVEQQQRPWVVKAASDQIVNMCFWGCMWDGANGGGYSIAGSATAAAPVFSTISFSADVTDTAESDTATTILTTIPGGVVTVYGNDPADTAATATDDSGDSATATVTDSVATDGAATTTGGAVNNLRANFVREVRAVESFAHNLAEAIIAPSSMTAMLEGVYSEVLERGFIHPTKAAQFVSLASGAMKQLETDPAYKAQRHALKAGPTPAHFNIKKAAQTLTATHAAGLAKMTSLPEGKQAFHNAKQLAEHFMNEFLVH